MVNRSGAGRHNGAMRQRSYGAVDVHYPPDGGARAALVVAAGESFGPPLSEHTVWLDEVAAYQPGLFYLRELPAVRAVVAVAATPLEVLVVDGYVDLDPHGRPGLGRYVHDALGTAVVGVAKTSFQSATHAVAVQRGGSTRPVYVTAAGLPVARAAALVSAMVGPHRLPDALRRVDRLARTG